MNLLEPTEAIMQYAETKDLSWRSKKYSFLFKSRRVANNTAEEFQMKNFNKFVTFP